MTSPPAVGRPAFLLGFAGLLPALLGVGWMAVGERDAVLLVLIYAIIILSFLGGMWWGFAMRRGAGQGRLVALAVGPSLVAFALALAAFPLMARPGGPPWLLVATGVAIMLTLPVDRHLVATGDAPPNWMRLRVPLSLGLGGLTVLAGALAG